MPQSSHHYKQYSPSATSRQQPYSHYASYPPPYVAPPPPPPPTPPSQFPQSQFQPPASKPAAPGPQKPSPNVFSRLNPRRSHNANSPPPIPPKVPDPNYPGYPDFPDYPGYPNYSKYPNHHRQYPPAPPSSISSRSTSSSNSSSSSGSAWRYGSSSVPNLSHLHLDDPPRRTTTRPRNLNIRIPKGHMPRGYKPPSVESAPQSPLSLVTLSSDSKHVLDENESYFPDSTAETLVQLPQELPPKHSEPKPGPQSQRMQHPRHAGIFKPTLRKSDSWKGYPLQMYEGFPEGSGSDSHADSESETRRESSAGSSPGEQGKCCMSSPSTPPSDHQYDVHSQAQEPMEQAPTLGDRGLHAQAMGFDPSPLPARERRPYSHSPSPQTKYQPPPTQPSPQQARPSPQQRYQPTPPPSLATQAPPRPPPPPPPQQKRDLSPKSLRLLPICPGKKQESRGKWFQMPSVPNFDICLNCYYTHIHPSPFFRQFGPCEKPLGAETSCSFNTERIVQEIWPSVLQTGNLGLLRDYALMRSTIPECHSISGNPLSGLSSRWWRVPDGSIPGFRCCDACYQDIVMTTGFTPYLAPANPQPEEQAWICDLSLSFVAGGMLSISKYQEKEKSIKAQWDMFKDVVQYRLSVMPCPGQAAVKSVGREWWVPASSLPGLTICGACHCDYVVPHFEGKFVRDAPAPQQLVTCAMASLAIRVPWDCAVQKKSFQLWFDAVHAFMKSPPCTERGFPDHVVRGEWFTLQHHQKDLENFRCCRTCYYSLLRPLGLHVYFEPIQYAVQSPPAPPRICSLRPDSSRYVAYVEKLREAANQKDFDAFLSYVIPRAKIPPCMPGNFLARSKWYGTDEFVVCEECWFEYVRNSVLGNQLTVYAHFDHAPQACDLYSPRMKRIWAEACAKRDIKHFASMAVKRGVIYCQVLERSKEISEEINARKGIGGGGGGRLMMYPGSGGNPRQGTGGGSIMDMETAELYRELDSLQRRWKSVE